MLIIFVKIFHIISKYQMSKRSPDQVFDSHFSKKQKKQKRKQCVVDGCETQPSYNMPGETVGLYCKIHKHPGMVDVKNKRCVVDGCETQPSYNMPGETVGLYCAKHGKEHPGMVNVTNKRCVGGMDGFKCPYDHQSTKKYNNHCAQCFKQKFPDHPLTQKMKLKMREKELKVRSCININFSGFIHDKVLETGHCDCTHRRRIDHRKLINNTLLVIETDENQHKSYDVIDEEKRYDDLYMAFSGKWIYIRFNPDPYKNKKGKTCNPTMDTRLKVLVNEIAKQMKRIESGVNINTDPNPIEIIYLFYNEYN